MPFTPWNPNTNTFDPNYNPNSSTQNTNSGPTFGTTQSNGFTPVTFGNQTASSTVAVPPPPPVPPTPTLTPQQQATNQMNQADANNPVTQAAGWLYNNVVKTPLSFLPSAAVTGFKTLQGGISDAGLLGQNMTDQQRAAAMAKNAQTAAAPVNVPGLGNLNMLAANSNDGQFDPTQSMRNIIGKGAQTLSSELAFGQPANLVQNLAGNTAQDLIGFGGAKTGAALIGALGAGGQSLANPNADVTNIGLSTLAGGAGGAALQGIIGGLANKFFPTTAAADMTEAQIEKAGAKAGLPLQATEALKTMTDAEKQQQSNWMIQAALNARNPDTIASPMEDLAGTATQGVQKLFDIKQQVGQAIGTTKNAIINGDPVPINTNQLGAATQDFQDALKNIFANVNSKGKIDFSESALQDLPGDQKAIQNAYSKIQNAESTGDLIKAKDAITKSLSFGRANQTIDASDGIVKQLLYGNDGTGGITGLIHDAHPDLQQLNNTYSELSPAVETFQQKAGGKTSLTGNEPIDGTNTFNLLRKSLGAGNKENGAIVSALEDFGDKYNIPELQDLVKKTRMAQTAEDIAGTDQATRPTGITARIGQAAKIGKSVITHDVGGLLQTGNEILTKNSTPQQDYLKLLQSASDPGILGIGKTAQNFLKLLAPNVGTGTAGLISPAAAQQTASTVSGLGGAQAGSFINPNQNQ